MEKLSFQPSVEKDGEAVGHLPQHISRNISYFLSHSRNSVTCTVTGQRMNRGVGLVVKVPCTYRFTGQKLFIERLKELLYNKKCCYTYAVINVQVFKVTGMTDVTVACIRQVAALQIHNIGI